jgi:hypothetical protein
MEQLATFSENQLKKVSVEGLKSLLRMRESEKKEDERIEKFWAEEYPTFAKEDKAKYWAGGLFRSMRSQEESGQNPYAIYSGNVTDLAFCLILSLSS